jgi:ribonuclease Y
MDPVTFVIATALGLVLGAVGFGVFKKMKEEKARRFAKSEAERILNKAKQDARAVEQRARETEQKIKKNAENDVLKHKQSLIKAEKSFLDKESQLQQKFKEKEVVVEKKQRELQAEAERIKIAAEKVREQEARAHDELERLKGKIEGAAGLTAESAKKELLEVVKKEAEAEAGRISLQIENEAKEEAEKKAKRIISLAISRYAGEYAAERTMSMLQIPGDEAKGKIIGKDGRNIRALEAACGVDLIIDETPDTIIISAFDPVRREIARRGIEKLLEDGRVHPARIEEVVQKIKTELFKSIKDDGEKACLELNITGVDSEIQKLLGSLKYRTSFTQNNYTHSIEVGLLAGMMAAELGVDIKTAQRAGLLHDIGKAIDHSIEGSHAVIGAEFAKKHGEQEAIVHAIRAHHEDEKPRTAYAYLTAAADALSSARPGARRQQMETYVRRLQDLESIGNSFDGVIRTFAIQAGREIRVLVEGSKVTDEQSLMLSRDIARKIEKEMNYPGQIKITVIRETRAIDYAR